MRIIILLVFISNGLFAQTNYNCDKIKINDTLIVKVGDYVLDKIKRIDITKTLLDSNIIRTLYEIENPCSNFHSGYRGAHIIERKKKFPIITLAEIVEGYKKKYPTYSTYEIRVNNKLIENYTEYIVEVSNRFKVKTIKNEIKGKKIILLIKYL